MAVRKLLKKKERLPKTWPFPKETPKPMTKKQLRDDAYNQAPKALF